MILTLNIKNLALIEDEVIDFQNGLNIITGDTGAGKTILVKAISSIFGEQLPKDYIAYGKEEMIIEAVIDVDNQKALEIENITGINAEDNSIYIISRIFKNNSRSINRLNGRIVSKEALKEIGDLIGDIHNQNETKALLKTETQLALVDTFCNENFKNLKKEYLELREKYILNEKKKKSLQDKTKEIAIRIDTLDYQINEIEKAKLKTDEETILQEKFNVLSNQEKIIKTIDKTLLLIDNPNNPWLDDLKDASNAMKSIEKYDTFFNSSSEKLENHYWELSDLVSSLRNQIDQYDLSSNEIDYVIERLELIKKLKKKYGANITEILDYMNNAKNEKDELENIEYTIEKYIKQSKEYKDELNKMIENLRDMRLGAINYLKERVINELSQLDMGKVQFDIYLNENTNANVFDVNGNCEAVFMISPNQGQPMKPLSMISSGGEMARVMIVFKNLISSFDKTDTLVFDEIESGISGPIAFQVGKKISSISKDRQVICITHIPQVAAFADYHLNVTKNNKNDKTYTTIASLDKERRTNEIAKLLGGRKITKHALQNAKELIENAILSSKSESEA